MKIDEIEIHVGKPSCAFRGVGPIKARVGAAIVFSRAPTIDKVNQRLREQVARIGVNAVIGVTYDGGISATSWKTLTATGTAVFISTAETPTLIAAQPATEIPEVRLMRLPVHSLSSSVHTRPSACGHC